MKFEQGIGTWYGEPITDLSREGLLDVIEFLSHEWSRERKRRVSLGDDYFELVGLFLSMKKKK